MNKKSFIKELEKELSILDENEIDDIISEYKDIIDEKVKSGISEEQAVSEFGSIDELTTEILKAYKINPKYKKDSNKETVDFEKARNSCNSWIKDTSVTLSNSFKGIYNNFKNSNNEISIELVFELILKFIIMLVILAVMTLPFSIISSLGESILNMTIYPLSSVLNVVWHIFTSLLYFGVCILVFIAMFKEYVKVDNTKENKEIILPENKNTKKNKTTNNEQSQKENIKNEVHNSKINNGINSALSIIYKVFMTVVFLIPLWFMQIGFVVALFVTLYYSIIGINIWGMVIILIGIVIGTGWFTDVFTQLTFKIKKIKFYPVFISIVVVCLGGLIFTSNVFSFNYVDELPKNNFNEKTISKEFNLNSNDAEIITNEWNTYVEEKIDNELPDNTIRMEFTYYGDLIDIDNIDLSYGVSSENYRLTYNTIDRVDFNDAKKLYNLVIDNLKDKKFYDYDKLDHIKITIYRNKIVEEEI